MPAKTPTADQRTRMNRVLTEIRKGGSVTKCAKRAQVGERTVYKWRKQFEDFAAEVAEAMETGADVAEDMVWKISQGEVQPKSTSQLLACFGILKARRPEIWRENFKVDHGGQLVPVEVKFAFDPSPVAGSPEALAKPRLRVVGNDSG